MLVRFRERERPADESSQGGGGEWGGGGGGIARVARSPLVAFSEPRHGAGGTKEFLAVLIREPGFAGTVQDVVIECGNARYQDVVDRYMAGQPMALDS